MAVEARWCRLSAEASVAWLFPRDDMSPSSIVKDIASAPPINSGIKFSTHRPSFVSTMTTSVDRRRIPGPPSSYPALPLSAYTSTPAHSPQSPQQRNRASNEPRKICSSSFLSSSDPSSANKSRFLSPRFRIHGNILPINSSRGLCPRPTSTPSQHTLYPNPPTQHHFLPPPLQRRSSSP